MNKIPLFKPYMGSEEAKAVAETLKSGWITLGPKTEEFENKFAEYTGAKHAIAVNSATSALHLALLVNGIKEGDEVITTALTFATSAEVILYVNATPVFADIDPMTFNIDPVSIEKHITKKTKAIIVVHYGGQPCDMDAINKIARKHNLAVIEDAAHAAGSSYKGKKIGNSKNIVTFSFHAVKNLATGDGGMLTTPSAAVDKELRALRWMGINKSTRERETKGGYRWDYDINAGGFKYHMNDIAASIGLVQLRKLDMMNKKRDDVAKVYDAAFVDSDILTPITQMPFGETSRHNYCVQLNKKINREKFISYMNDLGISTGVHYKPLYHHKRYAPYGEGKDYPVTESVWPHILLLPIHPHMTKADARRVVAAVQGYKI
jgi:perosamine synthetase